MVAVRASVGRRISRPSHDGLPNLGMNVEVGVVSVLSFILLLLVILFAEPKSATDHMLRRSVLTSMCYGMYAFGVNLPSVVPCTISIVYWQLILVFQPGIFVF